MSPYPVQTDRESIIHAARHLIESEGLENLSLSKLAAALGIKAPSLYRYIKNKDALLQAVIKQTYQDLFSKYDEALLKAGTEPQAQLIEAAQAQRAYARENPNTYLLAYTAQNEIPGILLEKAQSLQTIIARISGEARSLPALRGLLAITHGFIVLELNGQFRRGGDLAAAFEAAIRAYLNGWK